MNKIIWVLAAILVFLFTGCSNPAGPGANMRVGGPPASEIPGDGGDVPCDTGDIPGGSENVITYPTWDDLFGSRWQRQGDTLIIEFKYEKGRRSLIMRDSDYRCSGYWHVTSIADGIALLFWPSSSSHTLTGSISLRNGYLVMSDWPSPSQFCNHRPNGYDFNGTFTRL